MSVVALEDDSSSIGVVPACGVAVGVVHADGRRGACAYMVLWVGMGCAVEGRMLMMAMWCVLVHSMSVLVAVVVTVFMHECMRMTLLACMPVSGAQ